MKMFYQFFKASFLTLIFVTGLCHSEESKWYMMIGGLNSMDKVSLFNWETLQQCEFGLAPFFGYGLTGFSLNDVPLVCGAQRSVLSDKNECYEYNKNLNQWTRGPALLSPIDLASSVFVPNQGWFIFGGNEDYRSQKLSSIGSSWEYGPDLFDRKPVSQQCAVKISDTLTAFIGGTSDPNGIVTFDWTTLTQRKIPAKFREARLEAGCAMIRSSSGENLVAVVGGLNAKSLEVWNPRDNTIQTLTEVVPPSVGSVYGLPSPQMFSINNGNEILAFFGFPDVKSVHGEVWKYLANSNSWSKKATLPHGKFRHVAFPVTGLTC